MVDPSGLWEKNEDGTYTAVKGDTLSGLSKEANNDASRWNELRRMDGDSVAPEKLQPGMVYATPDSGRGMEREVQKPQEGAVDIPTKDSGKVEFSLKPLDKQKILGTLEVLGGVAAIIDGALKLGVSVPAFTMNPNIAQHAAALGGMEIVGGVQAIGIGAVSIYQAFQGQSFDLPDIVGALRF